MTFTHNFLISHLTLFPFFWISLFHFPFSFISYRTKSDPSSLRLWWRKRKRVISREGEKDRYLLCVWDQIQGGVWWRGASMASESFRLDSATLKHEIISLNSFLILWFQTPADRGCGIEISDMIDNYQVSSFLVQIQCCLFTPLFTGNTCKNH